MPTTTMDSTALPSVRSAGRRPAENQIAAVMSMPLPLDSRVRINWPAPCDQPRTGQNDQMPPDGRLARRVRQGARAGPRQVLDRLQQVGQRDGANPGTEARQHHGHPEPGGSRMIE